MDDNQMLDYYQRCIVHCLVKYGKLEKSEAVRRLDKSDILSDLDTEHDLAYVFHEEPYYWAMEILYAVNNPEWYNNPKLWPPPKGYCSDLDVSL